MRIDILASEEGRFARRDEAIRVGIPFGRGVLLHTNRLRLVESSGRQCPIAGRALDMWRDGSVRWLLLDFQADHDGGDHAEIYELHLDAPTAAPTAQGPRVSDESGTIAIDTGAARFVLRAGGRFPFEEVTVGGAAAIDVAGTALTIEDAQHGHCLVATSELVVEEANALRVIVRASGWALQPDGERLVQIVARLHFVAASSTVRFDVTLRNPRCAVHPGGFWELGDPGSVFIRDATMSFALPDSPADAAVSPARTEIRCSPELDAPLAICAGDVELYQDSSGGENWQMRTHANRKGVVPLSFRGYRLRTASGVVDGLRATPLVAIAAGRRHLALTMPLFWQNFPKAIEASGRTLSLRLFPRQSSDVHELQGGEQKTHVFFVAFDSDPVSSVPLAWARAPLLANATPEHYCASGAIPYLVPPDDDPDAGYSQLVNAAIEGDDSFDRKSEAIDEYGWRDYGDLYADHEAVLRQGLPRLISHYNNQYDAVAGFAYQFMRSADVRWWRLFTNLAAHVVDIDLYDTDRDKAAYNHGLFWHTFHYVDVGLASHRSYPRVEGVGGGGPSPEHNYADGLLLHYFLTGDPRSRGAVVDLARWVIAMDDGNQTVFRWLARGETGLASATNSALYHGPGRGAGNSIKVLLDGHQLTREPMFLSKAEALIRRCIHPADDIPSRELLDAERRWSYTVFLHALGKYLGYKAELGQVDAMYAYARQSLLAYARWMADHESPYLDHPEKLEYPTETWAAQEMWKSEVFIFAATHSEGTERARFFERSAFFYRYTIATLSALNTRTLTRPIVLLLSHGYMAGYAQRHAESLVMPVPAEVRDFGTPEIFVTQKARAKKRLIAMVACLAAAAVMALVYLASRWI